MCYTLYYITTYRDHRRDVQQESLQARRCLPHSDMSPLDYFTSQAECMAGIAHPSGYPTYVFSHIDVSPLYYFTTQAGCTAGIAHPPGYPTYTMLAILFYNLIPFGSPAWRVNLVR